MWKAWFGMTFVLLGTVMSCAQVLGLEEAHLDEDGQGGNTSSAGRPGNAGRAGRAGNGGAVNGGAANGGAANGGAANGGAANGGAANGGAPALDCSDIFTDGSCYDTCATNSCCTELADCSADEDCSAIFGCISECPDDDTDCSTDCLAEYPDGFALAVDMLTCLSDCCDAEAPDCTEVAPTKARVDACTLIVTCDPLIPFETLSDCISFGDNTYLRCAMGASSCADLDGCLKRKVEPTLCDSDDQGWYCTNTTALRCTEFGGYTVDCAALGSRCRLFPADASVEETRWPCALTTPATCKDTPDKGHCSGTRVYTCIGGIPYGEDCARKGQVCVETQDFAYCSDRVTDCSGEAANVSCNGDVIRFCDATGRLGFYDCAPAGSTCELVGSQVGYCIAPGCTTDDADACRESCSGSVMQVCVGGAPYRIDCEDYGLSTCGEYASHPVTNLPWVKCL